MPHLTTEAYLCNGPHIQAFLNVQIAFEYWITVLKMNKVCTTWLITAQTNLPTTTIHETNISKSVQLTCLGLCPFHLHAPPPAAWLFQQRSSSSAQLGWGHLTHRDKRAQRSKHLQLHFYLEKTKEKAEHTLSPTDISFNQRYERNNTTCLKIVHFAT